MEVGEGDSLLGPPWDWRRLIVPGVVGGVLLFCAFLGATLALHEAGVIDPIYLFGFTARFHLQYFGLAALCAALAFAIQRQCYQVTWDVIALQALVLGLGVLGVYVYGRATAVPYCCICM